MARVLKIVIVDDHEIVRKGLRATLAVHPDWEIAGEASNGREALAVVESTQPDVVIMDISMPELNGLETTRQLLKSAPRTRVLILSLHESEQLIREVLAVGARGYLLKSDATRLLVAAIEAVAEGGTYFTRRVSDLVLSGYLKGSPVVPPSEGSVGRLSPRETEVLQLLAEGKSNKEVAHTLRLSVKTVETHRSNVMTKLELHSFSELVRYAIRNGIIQS
jgi:DNA-binding NarL/FixJ family response regulator